jgi:hypothetical protein
VYKGDLGEGGRTSSLVGGAGISPRVTPTGGDGSRVCNEALWHDADMVDGSKRRRFGVALEIACQVQSSTISIVGSRPQCSRLSALDFPPSR